MAAPSQKGATLKVLEGLSQPRVVTTLMQGFASGLPFLLTANTLGFWLRDVGTDLKTIGFMSWVGLAYSFKIFWAPLVDRLDAPIFGGLGRRRGWMMLSQLLIILGLVAMGIMGPQGNLLGFAGLAVVIAFASATQDIVLDAWRIEQAQNDDEQGLFTSAFQLGYRIALLVADALILSLAKHFGWNLSYEMMAVLMGLGVWATLRALEPDRHQAEGQNESLSAAIWTPKGFFDAVAGPLIAFFKAHGRLALLMLLVVCLYRLTDFMSGPMVNPLYKDLGVDKDYIAAVRGSFGLIGTFLGISLGGVSALRLGFSKTLIIGAILGPLSVVTYAFMAWTHGDPTVFAAAMFADNLALGYAGAALVAYMSSLASLGYTATQYAMLTSAYAFFGKFAKGFSGQIVDEFNKTHSHLDSYALFFCGVALLGIPCVILCLWLDRALKAKAAAEAA